MAIVAALVVAVIVTLSPIGSALLSFGALPWQFWLLLVVLVIAYLTMIEVVLIFFDRYEMGRPDAVARRKVMAARHVDTSSSKSTK